MSDHKAGRIVWHDLFTGDRQGAMAFYERIAGWTYQIEHATDFAWGGGEKDFVLAVLGQEAGAGFAETPPELSNGWIAYVEVRDVDATAARAEQLGGAIIRQPFDVPGVGRNALLRDPLGALIGVSLSRHSFPAPRLQFGLEVYLSDTPAFPRAFYGPLFGWTPDPLHSETQGGIAIAGPSGDDLAVQLAAKVPDGEHARWVPSLKVTNVTDALRNAEQAVAEPLGDVLSGPAQSRYPLLRDPDGAFLCLQNG
ncbi:MAG: VOC family protein [Hyphomonas sp.]|nr:VOC family protein [Hyphomonas sp.]